MAPKAKSKAAEPPPPEPEPPKDATAGDPDESSRRRVWVYGVNEGCEEPGIDLLKDFQATGRFRADFAALCLKAKVIGHPAFMPSPEPAEVGQAASPTADAAEGGALPPPRESAVLSVQSKLLDRASLQVLRLALASSRHLETLRLSGCSLDVEMLGILRSSLTFDTTVSTLHIDWNPAEVPHDAETAQQAAHVNNVQELMDLERQRDQQQAGRLLQSFRDQLEARRGSLKAALAILCLAASPGFAATAKLEPLDVSSWTAAFKSGLGVETEDSQRVFSILDGPPYGPGDGLVSPQRLEEVLSVMPEEAGDAPDPVGSAFASFVDKSSPLEMMSFRCCNLGNLEAKSIGLALASSVHLRALNLWDNRICDRGAAAIAQALEVNFGLLFLGLGKNLVTDAGLASLCKVLGGARIDDKKEADALSKSLKEQQKSLDKLKKSMPPPLQDPSGRERYTPAPHIDTCEEMKDPDTGATFWLWSRNCVLQTLNLEQNLVSNGDALERLRPFGVGDLILRGTPYALGVLEAMRADVAERLALVPPKPFANLKGWTLILE